MHKNTIKTVAAATVFAFGISVLPTPAYAVSTNIVAETEGKNTLTLSQIQDLAVIYNDTVDSLELSIKQLENQEMMTRNQKRSAQNSLYDLETETRAPEDMNENGKIDEWEQELADEMNSAANSASDMMFDQTISQIDQLNDALEQMAEGKEDLQDALKDFRKE